MTPTERTQFLAERATGIGGSDIASVFNIGYGCRLRLWREKRGEAPDYPRDVTGPMELGQVLEPYFREKYRRITGRQVNGSPAAWNHSMFPNLLVHVDGFVWDYPRYPASGVLEIKSQGREAFYRTKREGLPEDYILQLQHAMVVTGASWGAYAIGSRDSGELLNWDVERDEAICNEILIEGPRFWALVENGPAPEKLDIDDRRCGRCEYRWTCQGSALIQIDEKSDVETDETMRPLVMEYLERRALRDEANGLFDETCEEMKTTLGARGAVACAGHKVYYRSQTSKRWDEKKLNAERQDLAAEYKRDVVSRPLRVY